MLQVLIRVRDRCRRGFLLDNTTGKHTPGHLDSVSHRGKDSSARVSSMDLGHEYLAPEISKCLIRERLCAHCKPVRRANSDASI